mmetsp:Transcript_52528/g.58698  ORF Transcript_52528/g.58698 Transcript_52528/m.58698 type:complete len:87 (-) Transcript_52528:51-311(-)
MFSHDIAVAVAVAVAVVVSSLAVWLLQSMEEQSKSSMNPLPGALSLAAIGVKATILFYSSLSLSLSLFPSIYLFVTSSLVMFLVRY